MAVDLRRDWPWLAAGGAALAGVVLLVRGGGEEVTQRPVMLGPSSADYQAQLQATVALEQARLQTQGQLLGTYMQALVAREQTTAQLEAARLQAQAQLEALRLQAEVQQAQIRAQLQAAQMQAAAQQQASLFSFLGTLVPFIFGAFSVQTTERAMIRQRAIGQRMGLAYPRYARVT